MVKNCDRGLENTGQHFQDRGNSFSPYGPTLSREITYIYIYFFLLSDKMNVIKLPFTENETKESVTQFEKAHVILQCLGDSQ